MNELANCHPFLNELYYDKDSRFDKLSDRIKNWLLNNPGFYERLGAWISNYEKKDFDLALKLIFSLEYYNEAQVEKKFTDHLAALTRKGIYIEGQNNNTLLVMPDNKVDSAYRHGWLISKIEGIPGKNVINIEQLTKANVGDKYLLFVNDTHGSGDQFIRTVWTKLKKTGIASNKIIIVALTIAETAHKRFNTEGFQVFPDYVASSASKIFSHDEFIRIQELGGKIQPDTPLGYGNTALLTVYHFQCPNNTLPLIWSEGSETYRWQPLFTYRSKTSSLTKDVNKLNDSDEKQDQKQDGVDDVPSSKDKEFLGKIKNSIITDLEENGLVLKEMQSVFLPDKVDSNQPILIDAAAHQLTEIFIQSCRKKEKDLGALIDKLRTVFSNLIDKLKTNNTNSEIDKAEISSLAERLLNKILLFTIEDQWIAINQKKQNGQKYFWPDLDLNTLKVIHARLHQYLPYGLNDKNKDSSIVQDSSIRLNVRISKFLSKLNEIVNSDTHLDDQHMFNVEDLPEDKQVKRNKNNATNLNNQMGDRKISSDYKYRESFFWQISDISSAEEEVVNWANENIPELHWIILKSDLSEQIFWFNNKYLASAIKEYYKIWKNK
ncbi:hypothetical protein [Methylomonas sp. AM2-LC]|uniref:phosphoribosyltransferase-like protein n=1 Tax=Methylomonas sp. AM2-LC TaxID=3153301 RepID=UPI00326344DC